MSRAPCPFCGRWFNSKPSIRSHLAHCPNYTPRPKGINAVFQHECGQVYVSGRNSPKRFCPGCGVDIRDAPDSWASLGQTTHPVGAVPDGEMVEILAEDQY